MVAIPKVLVVVLVGLVLLRLVKLASSKLSKKAAARGDFANAAEAREHEKRVDTVAGIITKIGVISVWALVAILVLMQIGVDVAPLIAGAGVIGLAVGFGSQELVRNLISGFFLLLENHIRKGDVAIINGTGGVVEAIGLRTVVLRDLSGVVHVFENGKIDTLSNMTKHWSAMVFEIGVAYKEDTDQVRDLMFETAEELRQDPQFADKILEPMEVFGVESFGDSAVVMKARLKTQPIEQWAVGREYRRRLKKVFDERHIEIPFPHRTLYWGEASEPMQLLQMQSNGSGRRDSGQFAAHRADAE